MFGQLRGARRAAAKQIDERVFKARAHRFERGCRSGHEVGCGGHRRAGGKGQPQRAALHRAVDHRGVVERVRQSQPAPGARHLDPQHPPEHPVGQIARRAIVQHAALVQQHHGIALFGFVEIGGGPQHADPVTGQIAHHLPQFAARHRIDPHAGFVEQQQFGRAHHRAGQAQFLLHAARKLARQPPGKAAQIGEIEQPVETCRHIRARQPAQIGIEPQILDHRQVFVKAEPLRHVADHAAVGGDRRVAEHGHFARLGLDQPGQDADQRGLARAVGADQPGHHARADRDARTVERGRFGAGKAFDQAARLGHRRSGSHAISPARARRARRWSQARPGAARHRDRSRSRARDKPDRRAVPRSAPSWG